MPNDGDSIHLSEQLNVLKDLLAKNTLATERVLWIISDPETGLVRRVGDIGQLTNRTIVDQTALAAQVQFIVADMTKMQENQNSVMTRQEAHDDSINALLAFNAAAIEAKKPLVAMAYSLLEKLLWIAAVGAIGWLGYLVAIK